MFRESNVVLLEVYWSSMSSLTVGLAYSFNYHGDKIPARGCAVDSVMAKIRDDWSNFKDLLPYLTSRGFLLGA